MGRLVVKNTSDGGLKTVRVPDEFDDEAKLAGLELEQDEISDKDVLQYDSKENKWLTQPIENVGGGVSKQQIRDLQKLSVDTGDPENFERNQTRFVAQVLANIFGSANCYWRYGEQGTGLNETLDGPLVDESKGIFKKSPLANLNGDLEFTFLESEFSVRTVSIGDEFVAYSGTDDDVYIHEIDTGNLSKTFTNSNDNVLGSSIDNGKVAYGGADGNVYLQDLNSENLIQTFDQSGNDVNSVSINGNKLAYGESGSVFVHNVDSGKLKHTIEEESFTVNSVSVGDEFVAYGGTQGEVYVHNLNTGNLLLTLTEAGDDVTSVDIADKRIVYGSIDSNVYVHDLYDGELLDTLSQTTNNVETVSAGDGKVVYGEDGGDNNVYVHDLETGSFDQTLTEATDSVKTAAMGNGKILYGSFDNQAYQHEGVVSALNSNTTYEYQAVLESNGETREGQIKTFTTGS